MELQTKNQTSASRYTAYMPDENGYINYSNAEDKVWNILYDRQIGIVQNYAANAYLSGLDKLELSNTKIPQPVTVSTRLREITGWEVAPVAALIDFNYFFELLANKRFPAASFIRCMEDLDYLKEPDIFHEIFGHCPMLTEPSFAAFVQEVGKFGATLDKSFQVMLGRLFWFTVEFGLIQENHGLRVYGAGILSSKSESIYSIDSEIQRRVEFNLIEALR
ncbi:MAG: phenylalanine-4-hydroxylase, partial [Pseudomonadota bacterium]|nr:phenylalanine-4-hydroxylase [Pseudomonadota bacterium]